jgi:integrase
MKLTTASVDLERHLPGDKSDTILFDDELTGFGLRLRRGSGDKVIRNWIIAYRAHGRQRRMIVGSGDVLTAAEARKQAKKLLAEVELGGDPQAAKADRREKDDLSFRWVAKQFIEHKDAEAAKGKIKQRSVDLLHHYLLGPRPDSEGNNNKRGKNWRSKRNVNSWLKPLHGVAIDKVTRKEIAARLVAADKHSGTPSAIALRSTTSAMFSWAMQMGYADANPVINAFKPEASKSRDRVLSSDELIAIWRNLEDDDYGKVIRMLILTASRRSEIGGIRWSEIELEKGTWTLPKQRSKNGLAHTLPIVPMMREIIESVPVRDGLRGGDVVFGFTNSGFTGWTFGKRALDAKLDLPHWVHHDIRRSVASGLGDIGVQPQIIEEILNHRSGHRRGVASVYNRSSYANEVRAALLLWSNHIRALVEGTERKVIAFERPAERI